MSLSSKLLFHFTSYEQPFWVTGNLETCARSYTTPNWPWATEGQRCPIYALLVSPDPNFSPFQYNMVNSFRLTGQLIPLILGPMITSATDSKGRVLKHHKNLNLQLKILFLWGTKTYYEHNSKMKINKKFGKTRKQFAGAFFFRCSFWQGPRIWKTTKISKRKPIRKGKTAKQYFYEDYFEIKSRVSITQK